ncbi:MAG: glycosyltransferase family 2 protein [Mariprofundales bacterium]|nr:glycosyltransferase family 2 protein [Mariprofundales bacterium]
MKPPILAIVIPCLNESLMLPHTHPKLMASLTALMSANRVSAKSFICYVDDGSNDTTWQQIKVLMAQDPRTRGIQLSRNFGHQNALLAGLHAARPMVDCALTMDADLQQDEAAIPLFIDRYLNGKDIVYGIRKDRAADGWLKHHTASAFYALMARMGVNLLANHADYRLMSRRALDALAEYKESNIFLRGLVRELGFEEDRVYFNVRQRAAGDTKYSIRKMVLFALNGITSFSIAPLRAISAIGFLFTCFSCAMLIYVLIDKYLYHDAVPGWSTIVISIYLIGGLQLLAMGVIGEYLGKLYIESKRRPRYIIEESAMDLSEDASSESL